jgi:hypothetical protein
MTFHDLAQCCDELTEPLLISLALTAAKPRTSPLGAGRFGDDAVEGLEAIAFVEFRILERSRAGAS